MKSFVLVFALLALAAVPTHVVSGARIEALAAPVSKAVRLTGDAKLVQAFVIPDQVVPAGHVSLIVQSAIATPSYVNVPVQIDLDGKFLRQIFVGYRVQRYVTTAVAAHDLLPGEILAASDLTMARLVFTGQRTNGIEALVGRRVIAAVRAGGPITIEATQPNEIVRAGNTVTLLVDNNGVTIAADVVARSSGGLGDDVAVYNPQTNKTLTGVVVGPNRVELNLTGETP
jgi:flagella basal body P-ring formation protein FlgA